MNRFISAVVWLFTAYSAMALPHQAMVTIQVRGAFGMTLPELNGIKKSPEFLGHLARMIDPLRFEGVAEIEEDDLAKLSARLRIAEGKEKRTFQMFATGFTAEEAQLLAIRFAETFSQELNEGEKRRTDKILAELNRALEEQGERVRAKREALQKLIEKYGFELPDSPKSAD